MAADALKTPGAAVLLAFIGDVLQDKGDLQGALKMYQRSQHIREATQTVDSIWGAHQLSQTGSLHLDLGDVETAAPLIEQAEQILLQLGLAQTPEPWGTQTRMIVGLLRTAQGRHEAAVTAFEQAKEVATACGNLESRGGALILTGYGVALAAAGDRPMAEAQLREAKRIRENCGILDTGGASGGHALCQLLQTLERGESLAGTGGHGDGNVTAGGGARAVSTSAVESVTDSDHIDHSDGAAAAAAAAARAEAAAAAATALAAGVVRLAVDAEATDDESLDRLLLV